MLIILRLSLLLFVSCVLTNAWGQTSQDSTQRNSDLDSELLYQLLLSEMSAQAGDLGSAYALMLDAARKSSSARLYERAVEMALHARNADAAMEATQAWTHAYPSSQQANQFQLQILLGLNRIADTAEPLRRSLQLHEPSARAQAISLLPRYFARASDKKLARTVVEEALAPELKNPQTGASAWATIGRMRAAADEPEAALAAVREGLAIQTHAEEPALVAVSLISPRQPEAEGLVQRYLEHQTSQEVRSAYARMLVNLQRYAEAYAQTLKLTTESPGNADGWLLRGSLELQDSRLKESEQSLLTYLERNPIDSDPQLQKPMDRGQVQAHVLLAQIAEQRNDLANAKRYLSAIRSPVDNVRIQRRHAAILAREGHLDQALALIRSANESRPEDALEKVQAETQLLRDARKFADAYELLAQAIQRFPNEIELVYDQAMLAERLGKTTEMEQLLRVVMQAKPDYHHAYNALGYALADRNVRLDEARTLINQALSYAPNDPFILDSLAWVEFRSGHLDRALTLLTDAFAARPDAEIAAHLGEVLWTSGHTERAEQVWNQGLGLNPNNETLLETMRRLRGPR